MIGPAPDPALDEVLDAFAVEPSPDRTTLEHYLRHYPQYAEALIDLSRELHRQLPLGEEPESAEDEALIDAAWRRHREAGGRPSADPFAGLSVDEIRALAKTLDVPRQVITAFRDHRVNLASVPRRFLARLAAALNRSIDTLLPALGASPTPMASRSYKADVKPSEIQPVTFERVLIDAGVSEDMRARLLAESD
jgi:hypothetical protein